MSFYHKKMQEKSRRLREDYVVPITGKDRTRQRQGQGSIIKKRRIKDNTFLQYAAQGVLACVIQFLGDIIGQLYAHGKIESFREALAMGLYGLISGIIVFKWYRLMEKIFKEKGKKGPPSKVTPFLKMLADQILVSPIFTIMYLTYSGFVDGKSPHGVFFFVKSSFFSVQLTSYGVWPIIQLVNFYFVPLNFRVPFVNTASMVWNAYMKVFRVTKNK